MRRALANTVTLASGIDAAHRLSLARPPRTAGHLSRPPDVRRGGRVAARPLTRAPVVTTRHFAARRGSSTAGRLLAPIISRSVRVRSPSATSSPATSSARPMRSSERRPAFATSLARRESHRARAAAARAREGHAHGPPRLEGGGARRRGLGAPRRRRRHRAPDARGVGAAGALAGVTFAGWSSDVESEFERPVCCSRRRRPSPSGWAWWKRWLRASRSSPRAAAGTSRPWDGWPTLLSSLPGDADGAAAALRALLDDGVRAAFSDESRELAATAFTTERQVDGLVAVYEDVLGGARR